MKNEPETLQPDPRKLPPWYLTGIVLCTQTVNNERTALNLIFGVPEQTYLGVTNLRERWDNVETGEVEIRAPSFMDITETE